MCGDRGKAMGSAKSLEFIRAALITEIYQLHFEMSSVQVEILALWSMVALEESLLGQQNQ